MNLETQKLLNEELKGIEPLNLEPTIHCFNMSQVNKLADMKKSCDETKLNLVSCEKSFQDCQGNKIEHTSWYKTTWGIVGIGVLSFLVGAKTGGGL